jgi:hypothetical protein
VSVGRDGDEEIESDTPPTRSYVDALLGGNLTEAELANLRAEIGRSDRPVPDDEDENGARTAFHTYSPEERKSARPSGTMGAVSLPDDDEDEGGARTAFHTYSPEERKSARPSGYMGAVSLPEDEDEGGARTAFHTYSPEERKSARPSGTMDAVEDEDDDDAKTLFRPSSQPAARPISEPAPRANSSPITGPPIARAPITQAPSSQPISQPAPSSRPRSGARAPASAPPWSVRNQPVVELGGLLDDEIPGPPTPPPASFDEVPLSVPSLRSLDPRAADESYLDAVGGPNSVPLIVVSPGELRCLPLGAQAGFVVSCIDGVSTIDDIIDISGQSRLDTLRILYDLVQQGVVEIARR